MRTETARDRYYKIFVAAFETWSGGQPYMRKEGRDGDFVQLAALEKRAAASSNPDWLTEEQFARATRNYFASKLAGARTLADLSARFSIFWRCPVDSFGKSIERAVGPGAATPPSTGEFKWPHEACQAIFLDSVRLRDFTKRGCNDCERALADYLDSVGKVERVPSRAQGEALQ